MSKLRKSSINFTHHYDYSTRNMVSNVEYSSPAVEHYKDTVDAILQDIMNNPKTSLFDSQGEYRFMMSFYEGNTPEDHKEVMDIFTKLLKYIIKRKAQFLKGRKANVPLMLHTNSAPPPLRKFKISEALTDKNLDKCIKYMYNYHYLEDISEIRMNTFVKNEEFAKLMNKLIFDYQRRDAYYQWDMQYLYRIFAIDGFIHQKKDKTFGEYVKNNDDKITKNMNIMKFHHDSYMKSLLTHYEGSVLQYYATAKKNQAFFNNLTVEDMKKILTSIHMYKVIQKPGYSDMLALVKESIDEDQKHIDTKELYDTLTVLFNSFHKDLTTVEHQYFDKMIMNIAKKRHGTLFLRAKVIEALKENINTMTFQDFTNILFILDSYTSFFRSTNLNQAMIIVYHGLTKFNKDKAFSNLINTIIQEQGLSDMTYTDWMSFLHNVNKNDLEELPISLVLSVHNKSRSDLKYKRLEGITRYEETMKNIMNKEEMIKG